jgi:hypothetical protein
MKGLWLAVRKTGADLANAPSTLLRLGADGGQAWARDRWPGNARAEATGRWLGILIPLAIAFIGLTLFPFLVMWLRSTLIAEQIPTATGGGMSGIYTFPFTGALSLVNRDNW